MKRLQRVQGFFLFFAGRFVQFGFTCLIRLASVYFRTHPTSWIEICKAAFWHHARLLLFGVEKSFVFGNQKHPVSTWRLCGVLMLLGVVHIPYDMGIRIAGHIAEPVSTQNKFCPSTNSSGHRFSKGKAHSRCLHFGDQKFHSKPNVKGNMFPDTLVDETWTLDWLAN